MGHIKGTLQKFSMTTCVLILANRKLFSGVGWVVLHLTPMP